MTEFAILPGQPKISVTVAADGRIVEDGDGSATVKELDKFTMGSLSGWEMAINDLQSKGIILQQRDKVTITRVGEQPNKNPQFDAMILFSVEVER